MIYIFEQDALYIEHDPVILNHAYINNYFSYRIVKGEKIEITKEVHTFKIKIMQAWDEEGESWKFIQPL
jgi:hypothetical protein